MQRYNQFFKNMTDWQKFNKGKKLNKIEFLKVLLQIKKILYTFAIQNPNYIRCFYLKWKRNL